MTTKQELAQQLAIAKQKLSKEIALESWESEDRIQAHIQDLENQLAQLNMTNSENFKQKLGEETEKLEQQVGEYYFALEPDQRGLLILGIITLLIITVYWLTKEDKSKLAEREARKEALAEERLLRQMAFYKQLRE